MAYYRRMLLLIATSFADILIEPDAGTIHTSHVVRVEGLAEHPGYVLLAFDGEPGQTISTHRVFTPDSEEFVMARGGGRGSQLYAPSFYLMADADYQAWKTVTDADVAKQEADCLEGIGCAHISRFEPSYPSPKTVVSCGLTVQTKTSAPTGSPDKHTDLYTLKTASAEACSLEPGIAKETPVTKGGAVEAPETETQTETTDCATSPGRASVLVGLLLLGLAGLRRQRQAQR